MQEKYGDLAFASVIRELAAIKTAPAMRLTVFEYEPNGDGAGDYTAFTEEVVVRLELEKSAHKNLRVVENKRKVS